MFAPDRIRMEIEALRTTHPDVCDDDTLFQLALESETGVTEFMSDILDRIADANDHVLVADAEIEAWTQRKRHFTQRIEALRSLILKCMQLANLPKLELTRATLSVKQGQPKVIITDEAALPDRLCRIKREPDKKLIREHLESNAVSLPGATLSNAEPVLAIIGLKRTT